MASKDFSETKKNCQPLGDVAVLERNAPEKAKDVAKYGVADTSYRGCLKEGYLWQRGFGAADKAGR